jgi:predicted DNA-binding transcriptional regulator YafY
LWKLGGATSAAAVPELAAIPVDPRLVRLFGAVAECRPLEFRYRDVSRTVDPYRLDFVRGHWYVSGYDHGREDERNFRIDRIDGDVTVGPPRSFERPSTAVPGAQLDPWQLGEGEPLTGRVLVDAEQAAIAVGVAGADAVETRDDGSVVVELPVTNRDGFRSFVLGFLEHAEVLDPPELRDDVIAWLTAIAAGTGTGTR